MTVIDFIDVIDDIIDLSSDEETVHQDHIVTQPRATLLDRQALFVLANGRRKDAQAAFVSAVEESQGANESGNAVATASPLVTEKAALHTAESQNSFSFPTAPFPGLICTTPKVLSSEVGDTKQDVFVLADEGNQDAQAAFVSAGEGSQEAAESGNALIATASPSVMEKEPTQAAFVSAGEGSQEAAESGNASVATASPSVMEEEPLDTVESKNCPSPPTSAPLPSPASTTPKTLTSEVGDAELVSVKYFRKNYRTSTPRRSPRFEQKRECCNSTVDELAADHKRSRMLDPAQESAAPNENAKCEGPASTTPNALTFEVGYKESAAPTDNVESTKILSTDSAN